MNDISIKSLTKSYGENTVLNGVSFDIKAGKTTCIMGPSGCGKTTLINILLGFEKADSGEISGVPERTAVVFQEDRLFEDFTALSNIKAVSDKNKALNLIAAMGLQGSEKKPVNKLSGGMKRRVAIARALAFDADFVVMDEPFKGLDEKTKHSVISYVKEALCGKNVFLVTHDLQEAEAMDAIVITMNDKGEINQ